MYDKPSDPTCNHVTTSATKMLTAHNREIGSSVHGDVSARLYMQCKHAAMQPTDARRRCLRAEWLLRAPPISSAGLIAA